jgi:protein-tyrosine phosphatase
VTPESQDELFDLILVCTGNRVRSPVAEGFLRHLLADLPVRVRSLGTLDLGGLPPLSEALDAASRLGLDISTHRTRTLYSEDLTQADLVLGFERSHLAAAVVDGGAPTERVFSLPELVGLIEETEPARDMEPIERARHTIAHAHARRHRDVGLPLAELADPLGQSRAVFRDTIERVRDLSERVAVGLFGRGAIRPLLGGDKRADGG